MKASKIVLLILGVLSIVGCNSVTPSPLSLDPTSLPSTVHLSPIPSIEYPSSPLPIDRLGQVGNFDLLRVGQVCDGAAQFEDAISHCPTP